MLAATILTGAYVPHGCTHGLTSGIGAPIQDQATQHQISHLICGDLNATAWIRLFEEWGMEEGLWRLNGPAIATAATGSTLDPMLFCPGYYIPSKVLPSALQGTIID